MIRMTKKLNCRVDEAPSELSAVSCLPTLSGRGMLSTMRACAPASEGCSAEPKLRPGDEVVKLTRIIPTSCLGHHYRNTSLRFPLPINRVHFVTFLVDGWVLRSLILRAEDTEPERDDVVCDELIDFLAGFTT